MHEIVEAAVVVMVATMTATPKRYSTQFRHIQCSMHSEAKQSKAKYSSVAYLFCVQCLCLSLLITGDPENFLRKIGLPMNFIRLCICFSVILSFVPHFILLVELTLSNSHLNQIQAKEEKKNEVQIRKMKKKQKN